MLPVVRNRSDDPAADLAREEWALAEAAAGRAALLTWSWDRPVVVLGYAQPETDVDLELCRDRSIPVLRRITGGTAIVHHRDLALSLALPAAHPWSRSVRGLYGAFLEPLRRALADVGVETIVHQAEPAGTPAERSPICFEGRQADTLLLGDHKIAGCAQARRRDAVLVHALLLLGLDAELYAEVFRATPERITRSLGALPDAPDHERLVETMAERLAHALELEAHSAPPPEPPAEALGRYAEARWSPVRE